MAPATPIPDKVKAPASRVSARRKEVQVSGKLTKTMVSLCLVLSSVLATVYVQAVDKGRPAYFLPEERRIIEEYYRRADTSKKGLPPGLAKRGGKLPPGLQKHLEKNGQLPPGLQKRIEPLPSALDKSLPAIPDYWQRVLVERDVVLLDTRTNRILDIIENVIDLMTGK
jgi:hypothetical protein